MLKRLATILLLTFSVSAFADANQNLASLLNNFKTLKANFSQTIYENKKVIQQSEGTMALQRPGKFFWHTASPTEQTIIADGHYFWIYDIDLQQVTRKKQQSNIDTPATLLSGSTQSLMSQFNISEVSDGDMQKFHLTPKVDNALFESVEFSFRNNVLQQMRLTSNLGQISQVNFTDVSLNQSLNQQMFQFKAKAGVDVIYDK